MVSRKKQVIIMLDPEDWWYLSRDAARTNRTIRGIAKKQLMPLIDELKKKYERHPIKDSPSIDDVH